MAHGVIMDNADVLTAIRENARRHGAIDPVTGAPSVAPLVTKAGDLVEYAIDSAAAAAGVPAEEGLLTEREIGQIEGALGSQVLLSMIGVEEIQVVLKAAGGIGAVRAIIAAAQQNPDGFARSKEFWLAVANAALFVLGLRAASVQQKLTTIVVDTLSLTLATAPAVLTFSQDLVHAQGPDRDQILHRDFYQVVRAVAEALRQVIQHQATLRRTRAKPSTTSQKPPTQPPTHELPQSHGSTATPVANPPKPEFAPPAAAPSVAETATSPPAEPSALPLPEPAATLRAEPAQSTAKPARPSKSRAATPELKDLRARTRQLRTEAITDPAAVDKLRDLYAEQPDSLLRSTKDDPVAAAELAMRRARNPERAKAVASKSRPQHEATVKVTDARGAIIGREKVVSGGMTKEQRARLGFRKASQETHTEAKAVHDTPLKPGETMWITGQYDPCPACQAAMRAAAASTGGRIVYWWPGGPKGGMVFMPN